MDDSHFEQSLDKFKPGQSDVEESLPSEKARAQLKHMGGMKPEHILSDDSVLKGFVKNDFKKIVDWEESLKEPEAISPDESLLSEALTSNKPAQSNNLKTNNP